MDEIIAARPQKRHSFSNRLTPEELHDKLTGAWTGRIAGCMLGKPVEGYLRDRLTKLLKGTDNWPLSRYMTASAFSEELIQQLRVNPDACWADNMDGRARLMMTRTTLYSR